MEAIKAFHEGGLKGENGEPFRFVYVSGEGVDRSGKGWAMFSRVKVCSAACLSFGGIKRTHMFDRTQGPRGDRPPGVLKCNARRVQDTHIATRVLLPFGPR